MPSRIGTGNSTSMPISTPITPSWDSTASEAVARTLSGVIVRSKAPLKPSGVIAM